MERQVEEKRDKEKKGGESVTERAAQGKTEKDKRKGKRKGGTGCKAARTEKGTKGRKKKKRKRSKERKGW